MSCSILLSCCPNVINKKVQIKKMQWGLGPPSIEHSICLTLPLNKENSFLRFQTFPQLLWHKWLWIVDVILYKNKLGLSFAKLSSNWNWTLLYSQKFLGPKLFWVLKVVGQKTILAPKNILKTNLIQTSTTRSHMAACVPM